MSPLPSIYRNGSPGQWISFSASGEHSGNRHLFYKKDFELPCFNLCGKSYDDDNSFCLNLDLYADNSIYEIYVNGVAQSANLGNIIPLLPDPFNPVGHTQSDKTSVTLCNNWKAGSNSIVIQVASSATVVGLLVQIPANPPQPPNAHHVTATICEGEHFLFGNQDLTQPGSYFQVFQQPNGCDSNVVMTLTVKPKSLTVIEQAICEGETYAGYSSSGTYTDTFIASNGCDSIQTLHLFVQQKPKPDLGNKTAICNGDTLQLSPGLFSSYLWQDGSMQEFYPVDKPGTYSVTVTNTCGTAWDDILIKDGTCNIFFPNAFSPNKDGKNDSFKILTDLSLQQYQLSVFNRWGQKIFQTSDPSKGWDGIFNGIEQPSSVFIWICIYRRANVTATLKGTVALIR